MATSANPVNHHSARLRRTAQRWAASAQTPAAPLPMITTHAQATWMSRRTAPTTGTPRSPGAVSGWPDASGRWLGAAGDLVGPQLRAHRHRGRSVTAAALLLAAMPMAERRAVDPRLERLLVAPAGHDEPRGAVVGGLEQLEPFEAVLVVDRPGPSGEPLGQLVATAFRDRDGVDLDQLRHGGHARAPTDRGASRCRPLEARTVVSAPAVPTRRGRALSSGSS